MIAVNKNLHIAYFPFLHALYFSLPSKHSFFPPTFPWIIEWSALALSLSILIYSSFINIKVIVMTLTTLFLNFKVSLSS